MPSTIDDLPPRYLTADNVATLLQLDVKTVRTMLLRGQIPGTKFRGRWYVTRENLDRLMTGQLP